MGVISFYCFSQETWLAGPWKLIFIEQSRFYNFSHAGEYKINILSHTNNISHIISHTKMLNIFSKYFDPFKNVRITSWMTQNQEISYILFLFALYCHDYLVEGSLSKFYGVYHHVSRADKVTKFWMIKLCLEVTDIIHTNENADFSLQIKFWKFRLVSFIVMKNDHFKQKLLF